MSIYLSFIISFFLAFSLWSYPTSIRVQSTESITNVPLETYVGNVVAREMNPNWDSEALKAQAVITRSFALHQINENKKKKYDVGETYLDQVYSKESTKNTTSAALATKGEVLIFNGKIIKAFFHSCCGGHTENTENVWQHHEHYIKSISDTYCSKAQDCAWTFRISKTDLMEKLKPVFSGSEIKTISITKKSPSGRAVKINLSGKSEIRAEKLRSLLGYLNLKNSRFSVTKEKTDFVFKGLGIGHGVGLCQWGARAMAKEKMDYKKILSHYYPLATLKKL